MLLDEALHVVMVYWREVVQHGAVFLIFGFCKQRSNKVGSSLWRSAGSTEAHVLCLVRAVGTVLNMGIEVNGLLVPVKVAILY